MNNDVRSTVVVIGLGKIGLPLAVQFALHGYRVIGCDIDPHVIETMNAGQSHIQEEPGLCEGVTTAVAQGMLSATIHTTDAVRRANIVVIIVPLVIDTQHEVDFASIDAATTSVGTGLQRDTLVIYETTMPVGTTSGRLARLLEQNSQLTAGTDFSLAFSPERVSSGCIFRDLHFYPKVVGGIDERSLTRATAFYRSVLDASIIPMKSADEAEFVKLIETTYRDVNIALANEFACYADACGLDVATAIAAANTQSYSHIHTPGVGVGGHCIPVYPYFLMKGHEECSEYVKKPSLTLPMFARRINDTMAEYAVGRIEAIIGPLRGKSVLILGIAYRGNVREVAFTSAQLLREALVVHGAQVYVDDPLFSQDELCTLGYTPITMARAKEVNAIILQADHQVYHSFDFQRFPQCTLVLDGRKALQRAGIEALGMHYMFLGDGNPLHRKEQVIVSPLSPLSVMVIWMKGVSYGTYSLRYILLSS